MANPYTEALSKSATSTGISGGIMRHFLDTMQPTSQADALAKLETFQAPGGHQGIKGLLQNQFSKPEYSLEGIQSLNQARDARTAALKAKEALGWTGPGLDPVTFSDKPLWETYGFATPGAEYVRLGQFNAKNMPFASPGVGIASRGITRENIFPTLQGLYDQWGQYEGAGFEGGNKMGGNKSNWEALKSWNTGDRPESAGSIASPYGSKDALQTYLTTGQITPELNPEYALEALDYAERETARQQQRKPGSFLQQAGGIFADYIAPVIGMFGGPWGKALNMATQAGAGTARGQGFGSMLGNAVQYGITSGLIKIPVPGGIGDFIPGTEFITKGGKAYLSNAQMAALNAGITGVRGGDLGDVARTGSGTYFGRNVADDMAAAKAANVANKVSNLSLKGIGNILGSGAGSGLKQIGTNILIDTLSPPKEPITYDYPESTTNAAVAAQNAAASTLGNANQTTGQNADASTLGSANQTIGQNTGVSPYIDPVTFRGIGALGPDFMNVYERAARGFA